MEEEREFGEGGGEDVGGIGERPGPTPEGAAEPREPPEEPDDDAPEDGEPWAKFGTGRDPSS